MANVRRVLTIGKFSISCIYMPEGGKHGIFVRRSYGATHVHLGKFGFWYRYQS